MEGARPPSPGSELELSVLNAQPDEQTPLNGAAQIIPFSAEDPGPSQAKQKSPWSSCNRNLIGKCKLWMVIASIFVGLIIVIVISLCLFGVTYVDEDENEILELSSNKTFSVMLKIPEECVAKEELPHLLTERVRGFAFDEQKLNESATTHVTDQTRYIKVKWMLIIHSCRARQEQILQLTDVYRSSPSLNRYFNSVEIVDFSDENATITYHLQFGVPLEDDGFMKYMMSEELVLGILQQNFHDQNMAGCETLGLSPESLVLYE